MEKKIVLKTRLDDRISGGGETKIVGQWNLGPRNLINAVEAVRDERDDNRKFYGNIGAGDSWLELDGHRFDLVEAIIGGAFRKMEEARKMVRIIENGELSGLKAAIAEAG